jgi:hypothetical protein
MPTCPGGDNSLKWIATAKCAQWHTQTQARFSLLIHSKAKLLSAALHVIRAKGYSATCIADLCATACLTRGSFLRHFEVRKRCPQRLPITGLNAPEHDLTNTRTNLNSAGTE